MKEILNQEQVWQKGKGLNPGYLILGILNLLETPMSSIMQRYFKSEPVLGSPFKLFKLQPDLRHVRLHYAEQKSNLSFAIIIIRATET